MPLSLTTVTGTLQSILGANVTNGTVTARLANYDGQPRVVGTNILATLVSTAISDSSGNFSLQLIPNASIAPANTIYDFTFANADGQASGRLSFVVAGTTFDLDGATPVVVPASAAAPCDCITFGSDNTIYLDSTGVFKHVRDTDLSLSDVTTNNASTSDHGFLSKLPGTTTTFLRGDGTFTVLPARIFSRGGTLLAPTQTADIVVWRAPFTCTVTAVYGYLEGTVGSTVNASRNASNHLGLDLTLASAGTWLSGGAVLNTNYIAGDLLKIRLTGLTGAPTQLSVQVDFTVP